MSLSMEASCNGCERYFLICYQQIYWVAYLCQSFLEPGPSSTRLAIGFYSYKDIIQAQFTLTTAAIQASVMEKWGYQISYKKALDGKHKAIRQLFGDFSQSYT